MAKQKTEKRSKTEKPTSSDGRWWDLIERAGEAVESPDEQCEALLELLQEELDPDEILLFDKFVHERLRDAYRWDLWEVAYIMNGGCSDDGFDYFCGWLVGKGREHYEAALAKPEDAAKGVDPKDEPFENEMMWYVAANAWQAKTEKEHGDYEKVAHDVTRSLEGDAFDEDAVDEKYPELAKKFGGE